MVLFGIRVLTEEERAIAYRSLGLKNISKYKRILDKYAPIEKAIQYLKEEKLDYIKGYKQIRGLAIFFEPMRGGQKCICISIVMMCV